LIPWAVHLPVVYANGTITCAANLLKGPLAQVNMVLVTTAPMKSKISSLSGNVNMACTDATPRFSIGL
jgi:hypothetical protein